jgi:hypothetical protein
MQRLRTAHLLVSMCASSCSNSAALSVLACAGAPKLNAAMGETFTRADLSHRFFYVGFYVGKMEYRHIFLP